MWIYFELNENTTYQNVWEAAKAFLDKKFIALNVYIEKKKFQNNNIFIYFKKLEKEYTQPKASKWKEIINSKTHKKN